MHLDRKIRWLLCTILLTCLCHGSGYAEVPPPCSDGIHEFESHILVLNTEDTEGQVENTCVKCGYAYIEYLPTTGHQYGEWFVEEEHTENGTRMERRVCTGCHRGETRLVSIETSEEVWMVNEMDYVLSASIGGLWGYAALILWYNGQVTNWYKRECAKNRTAGGNP